MPTRQPARTTPYVLDATLYIPNEAGVIDQQIRVGTDLWQHWLQTATRLYVRHPISAFACRKERRWKQLFWFAYQRRGTHLRKIYIGKDAEMTPAKWDEIARAFVSPAPPPRRARPPTAPDEP